MGPGRVKMNSQNGLKNISLLNCLHAGPVLLLSHHAQWATNRRLDLELL